MTTTILTIESEYSSAIKLGFSTVTDCYEAKGTVIRWGNSELKGNKEFKHVINTSKAIKHNCHKLNALVAMSKVVTTPKIYTKRARGKGKILLRPNSHSNGENFRVVDGPVKIPCEYYGTSWVSTDLEYRVWFAWDKTICARRIRLDENKQNDQFPCRSGWGYKFIKETPRKLHNEVIRASKTIGLSLGAADVLVKNHRNIFLELNSAPTVDATKICLFYKRAIKEKMKSLKDA